MRQKEVLVTCAFPVEKQAVTARTLNHRSKYGCQEGEKMRIDVVTLEKLLVLVMVTLFTGGLFGWMEPLPFFLVAVPLGFTLWWLITHLHWEHEYRGKSYIYFDRRKSWGD